MSRSAPHPLAVDWSMGNPQRATQPAQMRVALATLASAAPLVADDTTRRTTPHNTLHNTMPMDSVNDHHWLPGMLCREQRTVLTTAAMTQTKRDRTQLARTLSHEGSSPVLRSEIPRTSEPVDVGLCDSFVRRVLHLDNIAVLLPNVNIMCGEDVNRNNNINSGSSVLHSQIVRDRTRRRNMRNFSLKLFTWLVLLGLMQSTCAAPHPQKRDMNGQVNGTPPKWINPCGMTTTDEALPPDTEMPYVSDQDLLNQIVVQAKNALADADAHKDEYVKKTFKVEFKEHHEAWKHSNYNWLPNKEQIPKDLGEAVPRTHLQSLKNLDEMLAVTYEYLQRFAAGLEQVSRDQRKANGQFKTLFTEAEYKLRAVLCEIQVAMIERNSSQRQDITRDIISEEERNLDDNTHRNLRDWLIYRDYMNALEYVIQVFEFFSSNLK